jgi:hypothetical protein
MTFEQHQQLGAELKQMRDRLGQMACETPLGGKWRVADSDRFLRAQQELDRLRSALDSLVFIRHAERSTPELCNVYYGARA